MASTALLSHLRGLIHQPVNNLPPLFDGHVETAALLQAVNSTSASKYEMGVMARILGSYTVDSSDPEYQHLRGALLYIGSYEDLDATLAAAGVPAALVDAKPTFTGLSRAVVTLMGQQESKLTQLDTYAIRSEIECIAQALPGQNDTEEKRQFKNLLCELQDLLQSYAYPDS